MKIITREEAVEKLKNILPDTMPTEEEYLRWGHLFRLIHDIFNQHEEESLNIILERDKFYQERNHFAAQVADLEKQLAEAKEDCEWDIKGTTDNLGYLSGHAWIGRLEPNTEYEIIVRESK